MIQKYMKIALFEISYKKNYIFFICTCILLLLMLQVFVVCFCEQTIICFIINLYHNTFNFQKYALFLFLHDSVSRHFFVLILMCMKNQPHIFSVEVLYK